MERVTPREVLRVDLVALQKRWFDRVWNADPGNISITFPDRRGAGSRPLQRYGVCSACGPQRQKDRTVLPSGLAAGKADVVKIAMSASPVVNSLL